ncbi:hypothetical protein GDO81_011650 [Engystomops pustulosus]|uniref:Uncharacterized protein n=1 Tax=Engystomops pustulosus TaxID=76066 RepID=A0AAV7BFZ2_ENGPU|nr:hypothetical protein GDO81_011650 [Engystomops pustulosus]
MESCLSPLTFSKLLTLVDGAIQIGDEYFGDHSHSCQIIRYQEVLMAALYGAQGVQASLYIGWTGEFTPGLAWFRTLQ